MGKEDRIIRNIFFGTLVIACLLVVLVLIQKRRNKIISTLPKEVSKPDTSKMLVTFDGNLMSVAELSRRRALGKEKAKGLIKSFDEVSNTTFYEPKYKPKYDNENGFYVYINQVPKKDFSLWLRVQYADNDWLFVKRMDIMADDFRTEYDCSDFSSSYNQRGVYEWLDTRVSAEEMIFLSHIAKSKKAIVRLIGTNYKHDVFINENQKRALRDVIEVFNLLKY